MPLCIIISKEFLELLKLFPFSFTQMIIAEKRAYIDIKSTF